MRAFSPIVFFESEKTENQGTVAINTPAEPEIFKKSRLVVTLILIFKG
jgi:hypothetical protein